MAGFKNLEDLVGDLSAGLVKLRAGELEPEELTPLVEDARELCDRLVLLRFKAHEFAYEVRKKAPEGGVDEQTVDRQPVRPFRIGAAYQTSLIDAIEEVSREQAEQAAEARRIAGTPGLFDDVTEDPESAVADEPEQENPVDPVSAAVSEAVTEALEADTPVEAEVVIHDEAEVSMMAEDEADAEVEAVQEEGPAVEEAVDTTQEEPSEATEQPATEPSEDEATDPSSARSQPVEPVTSLAEQMEQQAIGDLRTAFSLVEKYECIKVLFQDDAMLFDRVLEALDGAGNMQLALLWLNQHVPDSGTWDEDDLTVARFMDKLQRRYA